MESNSISMEGSKPSAFTNASDISFLGEKEYFLVKDETHVLKITKVMNEGIFIKNIQKDDDEIDNFIDDSNETQFVKVMKHIDGIVFIQIIETLEPDVADALFSFKQMKQNQNAKNQSTVDQVLEEISESGKEIDTPKKYSEMNEQEISTLLQVENQPNTIEIIREMKESIFQKMIQEIDENKAEVLKMFREMNESDTTTKHKEIEITDSLIYKIYEDNFDELTNDYSEIIGSQMVKISKNTDGHVCIKVTKNLQESQVEMYNTLYSIYDADKVIDNVNEFKLFDDQEEEELRIGGKELIRNDGFCFCTDTEFESNFDEYEDNVSLDSEGFVDGFYEIDSGEPAVIKLYQQFDISEACNKLIESNGNLTELFMEFSFHEIVKVVREMNNELYDKVINAVDERGVHFVNVYRNMDIDRMKDIIREVYEPNWLRKTLELKEKTQRCPSQSSSEIHRRFEEGLVYMKEPETESCFSESSSAVRREFEAGFVYMKEPETESEGENDYSFRRNEVPLRLENIIQCEYSDIQERIKEKEPFDYDFLYKKEPETESCFSGSSSTIRREFEAGLVYMKEPETESEGENDYSFMRNEVPLRLENIIHCEYSDIEERIKEKEPSDYDYDYDYDFLYKKESNLYSYDMNEDNEFTDSVTSEINETSQDCNYFDMNEEHENAYEADEEYYHSDDDNIDDYTVFADRDDMNQEGDEDNLNNQEINEEDRTFEYEDTIEVEPNQNNHDSSLTNLNDSLLPGIDNNTDTYENLSGKQDFIVKRNVQYLNLPNNYEINKNNKMKMIFELDPSVDYVITVRRKDNGSIAMPKIQVLYNSASCLFDQTNCTFEDIDITKNQSKITLEEPSVTKNQTCDPIEVKAKAESESEKETEISYENISKENASLEEIGFSNLNSTDSLGTFTYKNVIKKYLINRSDPEFPKFRTHCSSSFPL